MRKVLARQGLREAPDSVGFRPPILCPRCRAIVCAFTQTLLQDRAETEIADERQNGGEPPLDPETLAGAARKRWFHPETPDAPRILTLN